jgi:hypothetical protein
VQAAQQQQQRNEQRKRVSREQEQQQPPGRVESDATHKETGAEEKEELRLRLKDSLGGHQTVLIRGPAESLFQARF